MTMTARSDAQEIEQLLRTDLQNSSHVIDTVRFQFIQAIWARNMKSPSSVTQAPETTVVATVVYARLGKAHIG